ncbi:MAG: hypothetical protein EOO23_08290 [Comamonadaceae bacterium]|nr:MAG: hypothetical protein EOO23_08290 [Comamonadaceae bacterium]
MTDLETRARERIRVLKEEIEFLEDFLRNAAKAAALLGGGAVGPAIDYGRPQEAVGEPVDSSAEEAHSSPPSKKTRVTDNPRPAVLIPAVIDILRQNGSPMSRRELHEALSARGLVVKGSDPIKALGTILWRAGDDLVQLEGFGYWPKSDQYRRANYAGTLFQGTTDGTAIK